MARRLAVTAETWPIQGTFRIARGGKTHAEVIVRSDQDSVEEGANKIFQALVAAQDMVHNVRKSYEIITEKFDITESQLKQIEDEGLDKEWPPLCELMEEAV